MDKGYIYVDGNCIIEDDKGNQRVESYSNKMDEILMTQNGIEQLENEYKKTNKEIEKRQKQNKPNKISIYTSFLMTLTIPLITQLLIKMLLGPNAAMILSQTENVLPFIKGLVISMTGLFGISTVYGSYHRYKNNKKAINGEISKKLEIEKILREEKQTLEKLKQEEQKMKSDLFFYKKECCNLEQLRKIRNYLRLYYDCGYNLEKYRKYLQDGKLRKKLSKYYNEHGLELIEEYLKQTEENQTLTLKNKPTN